MKLNNIFGIGKRELINWESSNAQTHIMMENKTRQSRPNKR